MKNIYYLLHCNFTGANYEIGYGPEGLEDKFFELFRDKYGYDKYGESYDDDKVMNIGVCCFKTKDNLIQFVSGNVGIPIVWGEPTKSAEELQEEKVKIASEMVSNMKLHKI